MPVHPKFTREQVIDGAYEILRKEGAEALTARHLGETLGSSARPVFTLFLNMNELKAAAMSKVRDRYEKYIDAGLREDSPFKGVWMAYIRFAIEEPHLFRILFMSSHPKGLGKSLEALLGGEERYEELLAFLESRYGLSGEAAKKLYENVWLYAHGIATLGAASVGDAMDMRDVGDKLTYLINALLAASKEETD